MSIIKLRLYFLGLVGIFAFVLIGPLGSISATIAQALVLLSIPILLFDISGAKSLGEQPVLMAFLAGFFALAASFAIVDASIFSTLHALNFFALFLTLPLYLCAKSVHPRFLVKCLVVAAMLGVIATFFTAIYQTYMVGLYRVEGYASNANIFARVALVLGFVSFAGTYTFSSWRRHLFALVPVLAIVVVILSGSRGAFFALPIFVIGACVLVALTAKNKSFPKLYWIFAILLLGGLAVFALGSSRFNELLSVVLNVFEGAPAGNSVDIRLQIYGAGWRAFLTQPILGFSWEKMVTAADAFYEPISGIASLMIFKHLHSDFINFAVGAGIVGILCWLTFLVAPIWWALSLVTGRENLIPKYLLLVLPLAYFVFGLTDMAIGYDALTVLYGFTIAIALACVRRPAST